MGITSYTWELFKSFGCRIEEPIPNQWKNNVFEASALFLYHKDLGYFHANFIWSWIQPWQLKKILPSLLSAMKLLANILENHSRIEHNKKNHQKVKSQMCMHVKSVETI